MKILKVLLLFAISAPVLAYAKNPLRDLNDNSRYQLVFTTFDLGYADPAPWCSHPVKPFQERQYIAIEACSAEEEGSDEFRCDRFPETGTGKDFKRAVVKALENGRTHVEVIIAKEVWGDCHTICSGTYGIENCDQEVDERYRVVLKSFKIQDIKNLFRTQTFKAQDTTEATAGLKFLKLF